MRNSVHRVDVEDAYVALVADDGHEARLRPVDIDHAEALGLQLGAVGRDDASAVIGVPQPQNVVLVEGADPLPGRAQNFRGRAGHKHTGDAWT